MQEMSDSLGKRGMCEYAERFSENGIDVSVLRYLTDHYLEKIGVLLGHRRKMLAAIAQLDDVSSASPGSAPPIVVLAALPEAVGERRHLTVRNRDHRAPDAVDGGNGDE